MTTQTDSLSLVQLLDRLCELRPDWCSKIAGRLAGYRIGVQHFACFDEMGTLSLVQSDRLHCSIERLIESEMRSDESSWFGYASGCNHESGHFAFLLGSRHGDVHRNHQPSQAIALLSCLVAVLEQELP